MKLRIIIPSTSVGDDLIEQNRTYLAQYLHPETMLEFVRIKRGFPSVESELHGVFNASEVILEAARAQREACDGVFVHCFDDPGVYACRESLSIPVFGGYQPAILTAMALGERIGVITTDTPGILSEERKARLSGFGERVAAFCKVDTGVLDLQTDAEALLECLFDACTRLWEDDRIDVACLGCTAMAYLIGRLREGLSEAGCPIRVIEPLANGVCFLEHMVRMGYRNSLQSGVSLSGLDW